jgi:RNA polymerase sigma factor (sigma-70 family)
MGRREEVRRMKAETGSPQLRKRELFFWLVGRHLTGLHHFVRHQLAYFQAVGDLLPDELTAEDVVDAVLLRAYGEFVKDPTPQKIRSWLVQLARQHLETEVQRLKSRRDRTVRTEQDIPETPPTEAVSTLGDEILDFYEPDEDLKLEDVIPDLEIPTPDEVAETEELRWCVNAALAGMPKEWRRALLLHHVEGLRDADLARAIGKPQPEIRRILDRARHYLRQRLVESGCRLKAIGPR